MFKTLVTNVMDQVFPPPLPLNQLRRQLRQQRRQLPKRQQHHAGKMVQQSLAKKSLLKNASKIGIYLSAFGEVDSAPLIEWGFKHHKQLYLPQIRNLDQKLVWLNISRHQWQSKRFATHRLGMQQPHQQRGIDVRKLDVLVMPLLGFDTRGSRLGMGGGYYDRTLSHCFGRPFRLGIAYDFQRVQHIDRQVWDQPLDAIATASHFYRIKRANYF